MKPFRLSGLMRLRDLQEKQAGAELAQRSTERRESAERKDRAEVDLGGAVLPAQGDARTWQAAVAARAAATAAAHDAKVADHLAVQEESAAQQEWSAARSRSIVLDKLAQRHWAGEHEEVLRAEQIRLDEIAARRPWEATEEA